MASSVGFGLYSGDTNWECQCSDGVEDVRPGEIPGETLWEGDLGHRSSPGWGGDREWARVPGKSQEGHKQVWRPGSQVKG